MHHYHRQFPCTVVYLLLIATVASTAHASEFTLWYQQPAHAWEEALPLGNGRLGAMVYGGLERETIQLNEETFWVGGSHNNLNCAALSAPSDSPGNLFE